MAERTDSAGLRRRTHADVHPIAANLEGGTVLRMIPETLYVLQAVAVGRYRQEAARHVAHFAFNRFAGPFQPHWHMG
ncbi:hypothetical protein D3C79_878970 [compost metagenome]